MFNVLCDVFVQLRIARPAGDDDGPRVLRRPYSYRRRRSAARECRPRHATIGARFPNTGCPRLDPRR